MSKGRPRADSRPLTDKHKQILPHLAAKKTNREIADALGMKREAVASLIDRMMYNTRCIDRDDLINYANQHMTDEEQET